MNVEIRERLSALVDGEIGVNEAAGVVEAVRKDPALRTAWAHYHLASDALGHRLSEDGPAGLVDRVRAELASEPIPLPVRSRPSMGIARPLAGLALAASVAAIAILGVSRLNLGPEPAGERVAVANPGDSQPGVVTVAARREQPVMRWSVAEPTVQARLNAYLVNHNEYLDKGIRGMLPYARIVAYDTRN